jgi:S1-C subfamily serine protease
VISAGVIFNMILSYRVIFISFVTIGLSTPVISSGVTVSDIVDRNGEAARAGPVQGDVIMQVNGKDVFSVDDVNHMVFVCV